MISRAVLLAAGRGTRLGTLTNATPKPLLAVGGRPIIVRILDGLRAAGIEDVVIVTGYLGEVIERELGNGAGSGMRIAYRRQETIDGTARALSLARDALGEEPFAFGWGDIVVDAANYRAVVRAAGFAEHVIAVNEVDDPAAGAAVYVDGAMRVERIVEKPAPGTSATRWNNAGFGVLGPGIWPVIAGLAPSPRGEYELPQAIAHLVESGADVRAVPVSGPWFDIGTAESLAAAREAFGPGGAREK
ncbi:MAG: nucleotidyltransferase family protein [Dehalococcoidia bacterium]|nr:nucleotidyltransferase family protein [Dehalococcoidia bacterium]